VAERLRREREVYRRQHPEPWDAETREAYRERFSARVDAALDAGHGSCILADQKLRITMLDVLTHFEGIRYVLHNLVIMPNHVHVVFEPGAAFTLPELIKSWKGTSARFLTKCQGRKGSLWQDDYYDRLIRDPEHLYRAIRYIKENPMKAGLAFSEYTYWESEATESLTA